MLTLIFHSTLPEQFDYPEYLSCDYSVQNYFGLERTESLLIISPSSNFNNSLLRGEALEGEGFGVYKGIGKEGIYREGLDSFNSDTDGDDIIDGKEDSNSDGKFVLNETDPNNPDTDFDHLEDGEDDHPTYADWDCDGILDGKDSKPENADHDGDGVSNSVELGLTTGIPGQDSGNTHYYGSSRSHGIYSFVADADPATTTDPLNNDTDSDGIKDGNEDSNQNGAFELGETDPNNVDTDADGILDGDEDRDQDGYWGLEDTEESDPRYVDSDSDGLQDQLEDKNKNGDWESDIGETCAYMKDSDEDGLWDGYNVTVNNIEHWGELTVGTNPLNPDTDGDGLSTSFPKIF